MNGVALALLSEKRMWRRDGWWLANHHMGRTTHVAYSDFHLTLRAPTGVRAAEEVFESGLNAQNNMVTEAETP